MTTFYDLKAELPGGKVYDFSQLKGKVVLIVNTASKWCVIGAFVYLTIAEISCVADSRLSTGVRIHCARKICALSDLCLRPPDRLE